MAVCHSDRVAKYNNMTRGAVIFFCKIRTKKMNRVTKAVFPVAGLGTRFLPATKASPKEMLPVVDKPLIHYAAEGARPAGSREGSRAAKGKKDLLEAVRNVVPNGTSCVYIRQPEALGLGHAVLCAKQVVGDDPFAVILADDLVHAAPNVMQQMLGIYEQHGCSVIGVENVARDEGW